MKDMPYRISRMIFKILLSMFYFLQVTGEENVPRQGPFMLAANHVSYVDPAVLGVTCRTDPIVFMAKKELFKHPKMGWWFKAVGCIPADRESGNPSALKESLSRLKKGEVLGIFPEGTRSRDGNLQKAEPGIGFLALKSGAPVIPVYISGTEKALSVRHKMFRPSLVRAKIGKAVDFSECLKIAERRQKYQCAGDKIMEALAALRDA